MPSPYLTNRGLSLVQPVYPAREVLRLIKSPPIGGLFIAFKDDFFTVSVLAQTAAPIVLTAARM